MIEWAEKVWIPYCQQLNMPTMLIMDVFGAHKTPKFRALMENNCTELVYILPGYTGRLQPMDVGLNRPFKYRCHNLHDEELLADRNYKPTRIDVANWISKSWKSIDDLIVLNSWKKVGLLEHVYNMSDFDEGDDPLQLQGEINDDLDYEDIFDDIGDILYDKTGDDDATCDNVATGDDDAICDNVATRDNDAICDNVATGDDDANNLNDD